MSDALKQQALRVRADAEILKSVSGELRLVVREQLRTNRATVVRALAAAARSRTFSHYGSPWSRLRWGPIRRDDFRGVLELLSAPPDSPSEQVPVETRSGS